MRSNVIKRHQTTCQAMSEPRLSRTGVAVAAVAAGLVAWRAPALSVGELASPSFPVVLGTGLDLAVVGVAGATSALLALCALGGRSARLAARLLPGAVRGLLVAGIAGGLGVGLTASAHAASDPRDERLAETPTRLDGLRLPDRPVLGTLPATVPAAPADTGVVVARGDCLWRLAAEELGPTASPADIAERTRAWYQHNRDVIGPDPDLLTPGQRLDAPRRQP